MSNSFNASQYKIRNQSRVIWNHSMPGEKWCKSKHMCPFQYQKLQWIVWSCKCDRRSTHPKYNHYKYRVSWSRPNVSFKVELDNIEPWEQKGQFLVLQLRQKLHIWQVRLPLDSGIRTGNLSQMPGVLHVRRTCDHTFLRAGTAKYDEYIKHEFYIMHGPSLTAWCISYTESLAEKLRNKECTSVCKKIPKGS